MRFVALGVALLLLVGATGEEAMVVTRRQAAAKAAKEGEATATTTDVAADPVDVPGADRSKAADAEPETCADAGADCAAPPPPPKKKTPNLVGLCWLLLFAGAVAYLPFRFALRTFSNHTIVSMLVLPVPFVRSVPLEGLLLFTAFFVAVSEVGMPPY